MNKYKPIYIIIGISLILRVSIALYSSGFVHPDEIYQNLEQGYRVGHGYGIVPYEYDETKSRHYFQPFLISALMGVFDSPDFTFTITLVRLSYSILSIIVPISVFLIGKKFFNERTALIAAAISCFWWQILYFSPRTLSTPLSTNFILLSIALLGERRKNLLISGFFLGIATMCRFSSLIFILPILHHLYGLPKFRKSLAAYLFGLLSVILLLGIIDIPTNGGFLFSAANFFEHNIISGGASEFGTAPVTFYSILLYQSFGPVPLFLLFLITGFFSGKRRIVLGSIIVAMVAFSAIPHKEFRFIFTIIPLVLLIIANGIARLEKIFGVKNLATCSILLLFLISVPSILQTNWSPRTDVCAATSIVGSQTDASGLLQLSILSQGCGYVYLNKEIPFFFFPSLEKYPHHEITTLQSLLDGIENGTLNYVMLPHLMDSDTASLTKDFIFDFNVTVHDMMELYVSEGRFYQFMEISHTTIYKRVVE